MKVCFYKPGAGKFEAREGGVQRITQIIKTELEAMGIEVWLCTTPRNVNMDKSSQKLTILPAKQENAKENRTFLLNWLNAEKIDVFINQMAFSKESLDLMEAVVESNAKLVNVHHNCISCLYDHYPFIFKSNRPKWIGNLVDRLRLWPIVKRGYLLLSKKQWTRAITQSEAFVVYFNSFKKELEDLYGIRSNKIQVITNPAAFQPIDAAKLSINKKIIYVGRIIENQKRIDKLMVLWKRLHETYPEWSFDLVGDGPYMGIAKQFVEQNNLRRISFHGFQDPVSYWMDADIFTLTSDFEGFGMVLVEAQALGVVPVAFECFSAVHEVIKDRVSGIIVKNYDENVMFEEVCKLIESPEKLIAFKRKGLKLVSDFDKHKIAMKWHMLFKQQLKGNFQYIE